MISVAVDKARELFPKGAIFPVSLCLIVLSWFLYPLLVTWFFPSIRFFVLALMVLLIGLCLLHKNTLNEIKFPPLLQWFIGIYVIYYVALGVATFASHDPVALEQYLKYSLKVMFFIALLGVCSSELLRISFRLYAHLILIISIVSISTAILVALFYLQPISEFVTELQNGRHVTVPYYGLVFYGQAPLPVEIPWARLQGLSDEPGTFALSIFPAYLWFLLVEKNWWKLSVVVAALGLTLSFGAFVFLLMLAGYVLFFQMHSWRNAGVHIISAGIILILSLSMTNAEVLRYNAYGHFAKWVKILEVKSAHDSKAAVWHYSQLFEPEASMLEAKIGKSDSSLSQRLGDGKVVASYLMDNPIGTGAGRGIVTVQQPVSIGYALAALESGWVGGLAYIISFIVLFIAIIKHINASACQLKNDAMIQVVGFSVLALLFFGAQRLQPDLSFWQMWLYAMFFWLATNNSLVKGNEL